MESEVKTGPVVTPTEPPPAMPDSYTSYWWNAYYQQINQQQMYAMWASWCMLDRDHNGHIFAQ